MKNEEKNYSDVLQFIHVR